MMISALRRITPSDIPIWIAGAILFLGSLLLLTAIMLTHVFHAKPMRLGPALIGVSDPDVVPFSMQTVEDGSYQAWFGRYIGAVNPYYPPAVRLRNQLEFSLFNMSATPAVTIGKGQQLLETFYITSYCARNVAGLMRTAPGWAAKMRQMQDNVERHGQTFLYVVTPSKVAQYPEYVPDDILCASSMEDRRGLIPEWMNVVRHAGVHTVDTTSIVLAAHGQYPFPLFPQGGTHWNAVGSALATQAVEAKLQAMRKDDSLTPFNFTWEMSSHPNGVDADLALLMNLVWPPIHFMVPHISMTQAIPPEGCRPIKIVIVGGSFMESIGGALTHLPCGAEVVEYSYWSIYHISWANDAETFAPVDPKIREADLQAADAILYEENESVVGNSKHGLLLYDWLKDRSAN